MPDPSVSPAGTIRCVDCGYKKSQFPMTKCLVHVSGLHRWAAEEVRASGDVADIAGQVPLNDVLTKAGELEQDLKATISASSLEDLPAYAVVNDFLIKTYRSVWMSGVRPIFRRKGAPAT
jgi:hypothetical protein